MWAVFFIFVFAVILIPAFLKEHPTIAHYLALSEKPIVFLAKREGTREDECPTRPLRKTCGKAGLLSFVVGDATRLRRQAKPGKKSVLIRPAGTPTRWRSRSQATTMTRGPET